MHISLNSLVCPITVRLHDANVAPFTNAHVAAWSKESPSATPPCHPTQHPALSSAATPCPLPSNKTNTRYPWPVGLSAMTCLPTAPSLCSTRQTLNSGPVRVPCRPVFTTARYLSYIQDRPSKAAPLYAVLRDSAHAVLSVPPVINAEQCKVTPDTQQVRLCCCTSL